MARSTRFFAPERISIPTPPRFPRLTAHSKTIGSLFLTAAIIGAIGLFVWFVGHDGFAHATVVLK